MTDPTTRMPPLAREAMNEAQRAAADELIAGPRKGVKGPFIALLRSPELLARLQKVGEYLRFGSAVEPRLAEFATLVVSRDWRQQFEWAVHAVLARKAGVAQETIDALAEGRRPATMAADEALVFDFVTELTKSKGVSDATYAQVLGLFGEKGEQGLLDLVGLVGYFTTISMVLNVARIPAEPDNGVPPLPALPL